ncbi:MAG: small multi-drug export protein [Lachnospiraceae bacterium]|nr:small multi-drug export protein [Lachnospiraceae bacterium]
MDSIVQWYQAGPAQFLPREIFVMLVSMLPLIELRGGIVVARLLQLSLGKALIFSLVGNIIPIPFILLFIRQIFAWLRPTKLLGGIVTKLEDRAMKKSSGVSQAEFWGLVAFVGIPLPGTGGWTGSLIAALLQVDLKKASAAILVGIAMAATIMSLVSYGVFHM